MAFKRNKRWILPAAVLVLVILGAGGWFLARRVILPARQYEAAQVLYDSGSYAAAEAAFAALGDYRDAADRMLACRDSRAAACADSGDYEGLNAHIQAYGLSDAVRTHVSAAALEAVAQGDYAAAFALMPALADAPEDQAGVREALYQKGLEYSDRGEYDVSDELFGLLGDYKDSAQLIHVHDYIFTAEISPTCEEEGTAEYVCHCGAVETKPIPATGHDYAEASCTQPATCRVCGSTTGTTLAHDDAAATCTKAKTCRVCGRTDGAALGHSLAYCVCTRCGKVELTLDQLQGTWVHGAGHTTMTISGSTATVYWHPGEIVYTGAVRLRDYGFYVEGTYQDVDINGNPFTAAIRETCYVSKFAGTYFVDTYDDQGPYTWYKQ